MPASSNSANIFLIKFMNDFTPWMLLVDVGIISLLLLVGKYLRAKVRFIQRFFIPPSLLAGLIALILGPEVLGWLPLSSNTGTYAGILIALVFSTLPLTSQSKPRGSSVGRLWAYFQSGMLLQWALGGLLGYLIFNILFHSNPAFGLSMPAGYCGGHGTAAAIGAAFSGYGIDEMLSLAMTSATVGIICSIVIGMWIISLGAMKGRTAFLKEYSELPEELRTGILPKDKRVSMGEASFSAISLDSMSFNFAIVALIALGGYGLCQFVQYFWPILKLPVFSCAFLVGIFIVWLLRRCKFDAYISKPIVGHLGGAFTDYLVAFGVASIKIEIVFEYVVPLIMLLLLGLAFTFLYVFSIGARINKNYAFEKSIFTWGWFTGTMAMGIALLRIADPESKSRCLDECALAYLYITPVEIALVTFAPICFVNGYGGCFVAVCAVVGLAILFWVRQKGWLSKNQAE